MKYFLAAVLFFPVIAKAQDCQLKKTKDPYTKEIKISTGFINIGSAKVSIEATKTEIDFLFALGGGKCFDGQSTAAVYFVGTKIKSNMRNNGTMNCDGLYHFNFRNVATTPTALQNLASKPIASIRFTDNTKKDIIVELSEEEQQLLMSLATCIINESKALLQ